MPRDVCWKYVCVTSYNTIENPPSFKEPVTYLVYQRESGNEKNREHWQIYAESSKGLSIKAWQLALSCAGAHCEKRCGTQQQAVDYCKKEDTRLSGPFEFGALTVNKNNKRALDETYSDAIGSATSAAEFIELVTAGDPCSIKAFNNIRAFAEYKWPKPKFKPYEKPDKVKGAWILPQALIDWVNIESIKTDRPKCLVLVGPSRLGKTQWARSLGTHMYWRGMTNCTEWNEDAKFVIFDDIKWDFIPQKKSLLTCMGEATITDKYRAKKSIVVDKPAIVLLNVFDIDAIDESEYWRANLCVINITEKLYSETQLALAL